LVDRAGETERKIAAPTTGRPISEAVKGSIGRGYAASTSSAARRAPVKTSRPAATSFSGSMGPGARVPSGNARPKSAYGNVPGHSLARSKSYHHQASRPATAMKYRESDDEDETVERKGTVTIPTIPTIPKDGISVRKNASTGAKRRLNSLTIPPQRSLQRSGPMAGSRYASSPSAFRPITLVKEEPADTDCDDICGTLGRLNLGVPKAAARDSRVGGGTIPDTEPNPFLRPGIPSSRMKQPTPVKQLTYTPTPLRSTPRMEAPFVNRFTNERLPVFYDERVEAIEREFRTFKEKLEGDIEQAPKYKETINQLQSRGMIAIAGLCGIQANASSQ
jgi:kinesin family protein C1